jgi:S1-C subfamily serine protease
MRQAMAIGAVTLLLGAGTVSAGGAECAGAAQTASSTASKVEEKSKTCNHTAQECRDHMTAMFKERGWAGLELDKKDENGSLTVTHVVPNSPAAKAGFLEGDVLVAMNGVRLGQENQEKVYSSKEKLVVGSRVTYTVERAGEKRDIPVVLAQMPKDVLQAWIERHEAESHSAELAQK